MAPLIPLSDLALPPTVSVQCKLHLGPQLAEGICREALWEAVCGSRQARQGAAVHCRGSHRVVRLDSASSALASAGWELLRVLDQPRHQAPVPLESAQLVLRRASRPRDASSSADLARRLCRSRHLLLPADAQALRVVLEDDGQHRVLRVRRRRPGGGVLLHDLLHGDGLAAWMGVSPSLASWMLPGTGDLPPGTLFTPRGDSWDTRVWTLRTSRARLPGTAENQAHLVVRSHPSGRVQSADLCLPLAPHHRQRGLRTVEAVRQRVALAGLLRPAPRRAA